MVKVTLGSTGITVNKNGFGALPIQRISSEASAHLLRKAYEAGIDFYDTARFYTDSEEKIGEALSDEEIIFTLQQRQRHRIQRISGRTLQQALII